MIGHNVAAIVEQMRTEVGSDMDDKQQQIARLQAEVEKAMVTLSDDELIKVIEPFTSRLERLIKVNESLIKEQQQSAANWNKAVAERVTAVNRTLDNAEKILQTTAADSKQHLIEVTNQAVAQLNDLISQSQQVTKGLRRDFLLCIGLAAIITATLLGRYLVAEQLNPLYQRIAEIEQRLSTPTPTLQNEQPTNPPAKTKIKRER